MASTYSTSLKLELIGNGEQSGVWGTTTNKNLGSLLEQAITGVQTITMANADYTLTNLNGTLDEARNAVLVVQGTNSAVRKVIAPLNQPKTYIVSNQTTGGYDITIGASTGAYVTIPNGVTAQVYTDGTNFYAAQNGTAGDFTVGGNATVSGNEYVTGNLGVGTAAPISKLHVNGGPLSLSSSSVAEGGELDIFNPNGLVGMVVDVFTDNVGRIYSLENNFQLNLGQLGGTGGSVSLYTEATERMRITSAGLVGVGTSAPSAKLTISQGTETYGQTIQANSSIESGNLRFTNSSLSAEQAMINSVNGGGLQFRTGSSSTVRATIDSAGNVGIGTSNPLQKLHLLTSGNNPDRVLIQNSSTSSGTDCSISLSSNPNTNTLYYNYIAAEDQTSGNTNWAIGYGAPANTLTFSTGNSLTERMRIDSNGIVTGTAGNLMLISGTAQVSTSGTSIDFTGIPSWVKRITVMFSGVSTSGTSLVQIQLGTGGTPTYTTTGYLSYVLYNGGTSSSTTGFATVGVGAGDTRSGQMIISTSGSNVWSENCGYAVGTNGGAGGGGVTLGAALTAIRITTVNGTDTFDAGSINILYE